MGIKLSIPQIHLYYIILTKKSKVSEQKKTTSKLKNLEVESKD